MIHLAHESNKKHRSKSIDIPQILDALCVTAKRPGIVEQLPDEIKQYLAALQAIRARETVKIETLPDSASDALLIFFGKHAEHFPAEKTYYDALQKVAERKAAREAAPIYYGPHTLVKTVFTRPSHQQEEKISAQEIQRSRGYTQ